MTGAAGRSAPVSPELAATPAIAPRALPKDSDIAALIARRVRVRSWWYEQEPWADPADPRPPVGLALSGGGIRSATFALGLLQGLAKSPRDALSRIDILSTVSGGGYIGTFFRSLFVPASLRGVGKIVIAKGEALDGEIADHYRLARAALESEADAREIAWQPRTAHTALWLRNPVWWLREHSRYLAPTGATDYGFAAAYLMRNWLAMAYLFVLACVATATPLVMIEAALVPAREWKCLAGPVSPLIAIVLLLIGASTPLAIGYWATQAMSANDPDVGRQSSHLRRAVGVLVLATAAALLFVGVVLWLTGQPVPTPATALAALKEWYGGSDACARTTHGQPGMLGRGLATLFAGGALLSLLGSVIALIAARVIAARLAKRTVEKDRRSAADGDALLTAELRRFLTTALAGCGLWMLIFAAFALIDTLGAGLVQLVGLLSPTKLLSGALFPAFAFLIKKVPDWFGGTRAGGGIGGIVSRFASTIALVVGTVLYGLLAVGAVALVHHFAWADEAAPWTSAARWPSLWILLGLTWILAVISGGSTGFINLSSLHTLYSGRLTRAYLGAGNVARLELKPVRRDKPKPGARSGPSDPDIAAGARPHGHPRAVKENDPADYIQPHIYGQADLPAPIHLIHTTLNETIDPTSVIVARDRKGDILTLEPGGVRIGQDFRDWAWLETRAHPSENIGLGQWVAISGAAASAAMGRMSKLGYALAFTFANIRLGYWWWAPDICENMPRTTGFYGWVARHFGTFVYLANEMTCRYSRGYDRKYLTDGGHYENSGAYALIRRRVPLILVSDNGADPDYAFEDLQTLIRQVRIDLGGETTILGGGDRTAFLDTLGTTDRAIFVDPVLDPDWKTSMTDAKTAPFVLALRVQLGAAQVHLLWIKPRLQPGLPDDVAGYAALTKTFPQQPTGDQFFDEAQWESYRRLGEESMHRLLVACPGLLG